MSNVPIDLFPTRCNLCGGDVEYVPNSTIYGGRSYGSGYCYMCKGCGAYVGVRKSKSRQALGILANAEMRAWKIKCHNLFDEFWKSNGQRNKCYERLAESLGIERSDCHFGYFDLDMLQKAFRIVSSWQDVDSSSCKCEDDCKQN